MSTIIGIDVGYSATKVFYEDKIVKFPTAVSYASNIGISYGDENVYEFEGEKYYVGKEAADGESFVMTDFKVLSKFAPLIVYHILNKFDKVQMTKPIEIRTGLALVDWDKKELFTERLSTFTVNNTEIETTPILMPQGAGVVQDWVQNNNDGEFPERLSIIDVGYNTINVLSFVDGKPVRKDMKGYPGHGVSSIIKPFFSFLENKFKMNFSEQEAIGIFVKGQFKYNGEEQAEVGEKVLELKNQFVKKLFQSVLVSDKKMMAISDVVLIAGGGAYLLQDIPFPPNVEFVDTPFEFSNVRGYCL